jgi:dihydropteroate synthase
VTPEPVAAEPDRPSPRPAVVDVRGAHFVWGARTYVMAILNVTPDSFSGDGVGRDVDALLRSADAHLAAGADILDIGGESTRPGAPPVGPEEEIERVVPAIEAVRARFDAPVSVDTSKAVVAAAALDAGADLVNDVWGLRGDRALAGLIAARGVPVVIMHNCSDPALARIAGDLGGHYIGVAYADVVADVCAGLRASVDFAHAAGIDDACIIIDPGIGFGKTAAQNLELVDRLGAVRELGFPVLVGPSRKSFIGLTLDLPPTERVEGTAAAVAIAIARGADIVRVHDVAVMVRVARMADAIVRRCAPSGDDAAS